MNMVYLDYAATTPLDSRVFTAMQPYFTDPLYQGNPAASHHYGQKAQIAVANARNEVASLLSALPQEIIFTSGATEANHLAILGAAQFYKSKGRHLIFSAIEHASIRGLGEHMAKQGYKIEWVKPKPNGQIAIEDMLNCIRDDTILISLMLVNNETGVIQNVADLAERIKDTPIKVHCDATQAVGKIPLDVKELNVDYLSISAHKFYGPKGIGALYVRSQPKARLVPLFFGGRHEQGLRSGSLPTPQIVGMGEACRLAKLELKESEFIRNIRDQFWQKLSIVEGIYLNGNFSYQVPHILNYSIADVKNDLLLAALTDVAIAKGSACHSSHTLPSPVLTAMGLTLAQAHQAVRVSFGKYTTDVEINYAAGRIIAEIERLRKRRQ
jgi:cysteine desulfurase